MNIYIRIVFIVGFVMSGFGQITFNGCHPLFENQNYIFDQVGTDDTGRNIFSTTPIDGLQTCGGIGTCEFMIYWNDSNNQWEFIADDGNGDFSNSFLIYSNIAPSAPNPPSLNFGTWVENTSITSGDCGGDLSSANSTVTGDVQDSVALSISDQDLKNQISIYPNPVNTIMTIRTTLNLDGVKVYDLNGKMIMTRDNNFEEINVSHLYSGFYFLEINYKGSFITEKILVN